MSIFHFSEKTFDYLAGPLPHGYSPKDRAQIIAINIFPIFLVPIIGLALCFLWQDQSSVFKMIAILLIILCSVPVVFNVFKKFDLAKTIYTFQSPFLILVYCWLLGENFGIQYFFIILFGYPFVFFRSDQKQKTILFFIYNALCLLYFELGKSPLAPLKLDEQITFEIQLIVLFVLSIFCAILILSFYYMLKRNEQSLEMKSSELEKAYGMKQDFLATMSHELRTPLNAVVTISALLDESPNRKDRDKLIHLLKFSANNLLSIINDILDFSKLEVSKIKLDNRPHEFKELLLEIKETHKHLADEKGLALTLSIDKEIDDVYRLDDVKLGQILGNIIGNAIKFTELGRISMIIKKIGDSGYHDIIRFEIADTGSGIPEEELSEIFESFSQVKSVTTRKKDGSGLGLAIVKRLLNLYDAEIKVESSIGKGSRFYFDLSLKRGGQVLKLEDEKIDALLGKKLLLVEDNAINSMVAQKLLASWGIIVKLAFNGEEAIAKCKAEEYDLILMDLHMPVMDGFNAAKHIREVENINIYTPIFALTADVTGETNRTYNKYFDGFLTKPIQKEKLQKLLVSQLS
ncbi:MAG: signal transduction histidine kinase/CheY-like chemotaxis protein [Cyclobacteriaceae bacterium]|jgi:signal transduction histidine kinase/CheY-like chemotaxis protein